MLNSQFHSIELCFTTQESRKIALKRAITQIPDDIGVYYFFGDDGEPLYIGKSIHLRQRLLEHFQSAYRGDDESRRQFKFITQTCRLSWRLCLSELHALVLENREIKTRFPLYNRAQRRLKKCYSWQFSSKNPLHLQLHSFDQQQGLADLDRPSYGLYKNARSAQEAIKAIADQEQLCLQVLGIEKGRGRCFRSQINKCAGACSGQESLDAMMSRLLQQLMPMTLEAWPYSKPLLLVFDAVHHLIYQWQLIEVYDHAPSEKDQATALKEHSFMFDKDEYRMIRRFIRLNAQTSTEAEHPLFETVIP